jgi:molybdate transport system ATP-binding protein
MELDVSVRHRLGAFQLDAHFRAPPGVTVLFGRSGAGKTSIVNAVSGLLRPQEGRIAIGPHLLLDTAAGIAVPRHRRRVGAVFQDGRLFPHLSVRQNLRFGTWFAPKSAARPDFAHVVDLLGIGHLLERRPGNLSGGEKQRVAIGRALLAAPRVLLMDEPLASLDEARKAEVLPYLERLRDETRIPVLYVTHSVPEVARLATTVVVLKEGRVARTGPPEAVLSDPAAFPTLGRQEAGAVLPATVRGPAGDGLVAIAAGGGTLLLPAFDAPPGTALRVRIRARDVILATERPEAISTLNILPGIVEEIGPDDGPIVDLSVRCGPDRLLARITRRSLATLGLAPGRPCYAILKSVAIGRRDVGPSPADGVPAEGRELTRK